MIRTKYPKWLCMMCLLALAPLAIAQTSEQLARLTNPATTDAERTELIARGSHDPHVRAGLGRLLPLMLLSAPNDNVMESEAKLAGALKLESTIPSLVALLAHPIHMSGGMYATTQLLDDPVARALYDIGPPALPALAQALKSSNGGQRTRAIQVLVLTDSDESRAILQAHVPVEPDESLRRYLRGNLAWQASHPAVVPERIPTPPDTPR
jgi:hypothetical protein